MKLGYKYKGKKINFRLLDSFLGEATTLTKSFPKRNYSLGFEYGGNEIEVDSLDDLYKEWDEREKEMPEGFAFVIYFFKNREARDSFDIYFKITIFGSSDYIDISTEGLSKETSISLHKKFRDTFELELKEDKDKTVLAPSKNGLQDKSAKNKEIKSSEKWYKSLWSRWWIKALAFIIGFIALILAIWGLYVYKNPPSAPEPTISESIETSTGIFVNPIDSIEKAKQGREALRTSRKLRELQPLETGKYLKEAPLGAYGFGDPIYIGAYNLDENKINFSKFHHELYDFEIHRLIDGKLFLIGFVNNENSAELTTKKGGIDFVLFPDPWMEMTNLVSIPFDKIKNINFRSLEFEKKIHVLDIKI